MKKFLLLILLCLSTVLSWAQYSSNSNTSGDSWVNTDYNTTEGTDFWLTFMFNYGNTEDDITDLHLRIFATARQSGVITIHYADGSSDSFNVRAFSRAQHDIDISKGYVIREKNVENKGIHVTSTIPISLYAVSQNAEAGSQDATNVLPTKALQKEYVIQTYGTDGVSTEFAIVATRYVPNVNINVKKTHNSNPARNSEEIVATGVMYPGDVYLYRSNGANYSLSGTKICSDVPIAVFVGGQHADIPIRTSNKNHIYSQAIPTDMWGKNFVATNTYGQRWDYLRFTAAENNTTLQVYDEATNAYKVISNPPLESLETYQDSLYSQSSTPFAKVYQTSKPVETFLYLTDFTLNSTGIVDGVILGEGSPAMTPILPMELGMKSLVFTTLDAQNIQNHYVNISTYYNSRNNIQLDNQNIGHLFQRIEGTPYAFLEMRIDTGAHFLVNTNPNDIYGVFEAHVYGLGQPYDGTRRESYAYSAGSRIERSIDMLIDGQYIKEKDVCIPNTTTFTPIINHDFDNYHWEFIPANIEASTITTNNYSTAQNYSIAFPDSGRWDVNLIVNYTTPLCNNTITDTVTAIIHMHDTVHIERGYNDEQERNICYGESFYVHYNQNQRFDYVADTTTVQSINGKNTRFRLNKEYIFKDTIPNQWGCDSVIWQHVTIRPTYNMREYDTICYQNLPYEWRRKDNNALIKTFTKNDLYNKHNLHLENENTFLTDSIIAPEENLQTQYGCDSLVALRVVVLPDYTIDDGIETICQNSTTGYYWHSENDDNHRHTDQYGRVLQGHDNVWVIDNSNDTKYHILPGQYIPRNTPGTFTLVDSLKTKHVCNTCQDAMGCDSIHIKTIVIRPRKQKEMPELHLCDNGTIVALNDTLCVGYKYKGKIPEPWESEGKYVIVSKDTILTNHSQTAELGCDSLTYQRVLLCPSYEKTLPTVSLCQGQIEYFWTRQDNGQLIKRITLPVKEHYPFDTIYTDTLTTKAKSYCACDSILHLPIVILPTFDTITTVTLCDSEMPYKWELRDDKNHDKTISIPAAEKGKVWLFTDQFTLHTVNGCDSVVHLDLRVNPTSYHTISPQLCHEQLPYITPEGKQFYSEGTYKDTLNNQYGCDSIVTYDIQVSAENIVDTTVRRCDNEPPFDYDYGVEPAGTIHTFRLENISATNTYIDTVSIAGQCRTIYRLHFIVDPTFEKNLDLTHVCIDDLPYKWNVSDKKNGTRIIEINIPQDKSLPFDTLCVAGLSSVHGCDSIVHLPLRVQPTYTKELDSTICESQLPFIWKDNKGKELMQIKLSDLQESGQWKAPHWTYQAQYTHESQYQCDSILNLTLTVLPTLKEYIPLQLCPEQLPFTYCANGATLPVGYTGGTKIETLISNQYGCDSIVTYDIQVSAENIVDTTVRRCDNEPPFDYDYGVEPAGTIHTFRLENISATNTYIDTVSIAGQCRTIYRLHFIVDPTFEKNLDLTHVCIDDLPYKWNVSDKKNGTRIIEINIPQDKSLPFDTLCVAELSSVHGCDSIVHLPLRVQPTYFGSDMVSISDKEKVTWIKNGKDTVVYGENCEEKPKNIDGLAARKELYFFPDSLSTIYGCDSVYHKYVYVRPTYAQESTDSICQYSFENSYRWEGHENHSTVFNENGERITNIATDHVGIFRYIDSLKTKVGEDDSIWILTLTIHPTYAYVGEKDTTYVDICDNDTYHFRDVTTDTLYNSKKDWITGDYSIGRHVITGMDTTIMGCDSAVAHVIYVHPSYHLTEKDTTCQVYGGFYEWIHDGVKEESISIDKGDTTIFIGKEYKTQTYECDSILGFELYVAPVYHIYDTLFDMCENDTISWRGILFAGREFANYHPSGYDPTLYRRVQSNLTGKTDYYSDTAHYSTIYGCDSVYHIALKVNPVFRKTIIDSICQTEEGYYYKNLNRGEGGNLPARYLSDSLTRNDTLYTINGCDSIITLHLRVDSVYHYGVSYTFCQDTIETMREWIDEEGRSHGFVLDVSLPGDFNETIALKTIHGCDSTFGVSWHVDPIYRFDTIIHLCENDRAVWQDTLYTGDSVRSITPEDSVILAPGVYHRFKHFTTIAGCDSDYYATICVHAVYDTLRYVTVCESDGFVWKQEERPNNEYRTYADTIIPVAYCDTIRILPHEAELPQPKRDTLMRYRERMLQTIYGCDSLSKVWVIVQPTYCFLSDTTICANDRVKYRGKFFSAKDTIYIDHLYTEDGCDSVYILRLHVRPIFMNVRRITMCDNETLYHKSLNHDDPVWKPGDEVRDSIWEYYDMIYTDANGCDSIYRYYLTIYPAYSTIDSSVVLCSLDTILLHGNKYVGERIDFPVDTFVKPYHAYYGDTLRTIHNCDSILGIYATIYPSYRHRDTIIICDDGETEWRGTRYKGSMFGNTPGNGYAAGEHIIYDSLKTTLHGCDSIYELHLIVTPTYLFEEHVNKCADEDMTWRSINMDHLPVGEYFFYDSLTTTGYGCDSVYHLYLTVNDTSSEVRHDTICRTEIYDFHGLPLTEPGYYYDTTLNEWGCHHYTHLYLYVIEPTVPTAWADSICADEDAYDLFYTYTGEFDPVAYSVLYDEEGHFYGFEDIINHPITTPDELSWLRIPMPLRDNDSTKYPKPNYYNITLVLDNGICTNPDLCSTDTSIVLNYPSWLTRQRFGDVIALYNEKYNGGYYWSHYQWYHGDTLLVGENHEYLYVPTGLVVGDQYHVRLTREGETRDFQTCPITIVTDPVNNDFAPNMGYLSVVPKCVCSCHKFIQILSRKDGIYRIHDMTGRRMTGDEVFHADVTEVEVPFPDGVYFVQLWSPDTPEEPYRSIKIIISPLCLEHYEDIPF